MNYFQRKRFMKTQWLAHFTHRVPGGVVLDMSTARRREPGEAVLPLELEAMGLTAKDVAPPASKPATLEVYEPAPPPESPTIEMVRPAQALVLGYNPAED